MENTTLHEGHNTHNPLFKNSTHHLNLSKLLYYKTLNLQEDGSSGQNTSEGTRGDLEGRGTSGVWSWGNWGAGVGWWWSIGWDVCWGNICRWWARGGCGGLGNICDGLWAVGHSDGGWSGDIVCRASNGQGGGLRAVSNVGAGDRGGVVVWSSRGGVLVRVVASTGGGGGSNGGRSSDDSGELHFVGIWSFVGNKNW